MRLSRSIVALAVLCLAVASKAEGDQQFAVIGDLKLQSGAVLKDCRVGYRTFGKLNETKSNAVLVPTWFLGKTADLTGSFRSGGLVDSGKFYVIAVDALGNGVSSSPSNSPSQKDAKFPAITIRDMVESQHAALLKLGVRHLRAVLGISMGGMQTFQWATAYPDFMDCAVPIVGSPKPTSYDLMVYGSGLKAMREACQNAGARAGLVRTFADFFYLALNTPSYYVRSVSREKAATQPEAFENALLAWNPYDVAADLEALCKQDALGGQVRARMLIVSAAQDHCVNPAPALSFAKKIGARTIVLQGDEGHSTPGASLAILSPAIDKFLCAP